MPKHHDRTVGVRITANAILVDYSLALNDRTLAEDLYPFSGEIDLAGGVDQLYKEYANRYGPRIAADLKMLLNDRAIPMTYAGSQLVKEKDHLRYEFQFKGPLPPASDSHQVDHHLVVEDQAFASQPGDFRIAVRGDEGIKVIQSNVNRFPEAARPVTLQGLNSDQEREQRTARVTFRTIGPPQPNQSQAPESPTELQIQGAGGEDSLKLLKLINSNFGLALVLALGFLYGAMHALQPGHGKTLVAAYLVGERGTVLHALYLGAVTSFSHTSIVFLLALVRLAFPEGERLQAELHFGLVLGYGLIVTLMGFWLLLRRLSGEADHVHLFGGHDHHHHGHAHHHEHPHNPQSGDPQRSTNRVGWWALTTLGITGGLVPCLDALLLLLFTWSTGHRRLGLWMVLAFSLGLASVLVAVGILVVKFKRFATSHWGEGRLVRALPILGALITLGLGLWMCWDALSQRPKQTSQIAVQEARSE